MKTFAVCGIAFFFSTAPALALPGPDSTPVPTVPLPVSSLKESGFKDAAFRQFENYVFGFSADSNFETDSLVILHRGKLVYERYTNGYSSEMRHIGWSLTKSVLMALVGVSEKEGKLKRSDLITKYFPDYKGTAWDQVKLENLMSMSSGMEWNEGYESSPFRSNVVAMLYRFPMLTDMATYRITRNARHAYAGERFNYSSGDTNLLSKVLKRAWGTDYTDFPWKKLFNPIHANSFVLEQDVSGTFVGSSYSYATPRDFARIGQLFLQNGVWEGKAILPSDWAELAYTPSPALRFPRSDHTPKSQAYGHAFWLNRALPDAMIPKKIQTVGEDLYWAEGHDGQYLFIWPSKELVVARFGTDRYSKVLDLPRFFYLLNEALP